MNTASFGRKLTGLLAAALLTAGLSTQALAQKSIKIGNVEPLSGPSASVGVQGKQAREMAIEEINAAGGIKSLGGAKLELVYADSKSDPTVGVSETERLINTEKVNIMTGCWNSAVTYPATQTAERYGIPFVVPVAVRDTITERGFKYVFRIAAKDSWWVRDQFRFLKDIQEETGQKMKTIAFVFENGDWGTGFAEKWRDLAKKEGYQIVLDEPYPSTATDLTPVVTKLKSANPDVVMLVSNASDAILLTNTMAEMKVKPKAIIASGGGHADPKFLENVAKNGLYLFDEVEWNTDVNKPGAKATNEKFKKKYGYDLTGESVDAYAAMYVIADALERAASTDPKKVRDALAATKLTTGPAMIVSYDGVEFDENGQNKNAGIVIVQVAEVDGKLDRVTVWPKAARRAGYTPVFPANK
ncbi:Leucine-, isoleucine-, valine-, threonine-, and alanine-binding protein [Fundidesulfovibrio magnetotacticus]|uniref:Leucine-, isoleucine-, valine-, threonine-, and alanine-binding protein n=1 Tax=Fundidesulfovibrio magnetotacticus TaxID=2730080 RepID=A0A6V8LUM9_9BACT|nr:ABC transporter substrate-binding protein [Fundidesulfovibrio magnetotacticus]GFK96103.1 Leucine-, isoleucine-, valine-, threonine-, and alanine-binding protein [Fundidesulfovibrio magnetotacticus]